MVSASQWAPSWHQYVRRMHIGVGIIRPTGSNACPNVFENLSVMPQRRQRRRFSLTVAAPLKTASSLSRDAALLPNERRICEPLSHS